MSEPTGRKQADTQFKPGQSGNPKGRKKGSRNKLGEAFIAALHEDFEEHGAAAIETVRAEKPDAYLKVIAQVIPSQLNVNVERDLSDAELDQRIRQLAAALELEVGVGGTPDGEAAQDQSQSAGDVSPLH